MKRISSRRGNSTNSLANSKMRSKWESQKSLYSQISVNDTPTLLHNRSVTTRTHDRISYPIEIIDDYPKSKTKHHVRQRGWASPNAAPYQPLGVPDLSLKNKRITNQNKEQELNTDTKSIEKGQFNSPKGISAGSHHQRNNSFLGASNAQFGSCKEDEQRSAQTAQPVRPPKIFKDTSVNILKQSISRSVARVSKVKHGSGYSDNFEAIWYPVGFNVPGEEEKIRLPYRLVTREWKENAIERVKNEKVTFQEIMYSFTKLEQTEPDKTAGAYYDAGKKRKCYEATAIAPSFPIVEEEDEEKHLVEESTIYLPYTTRKIQDLPGKAMPNVIEYSQLTKITANSGGSDSRRPTITSQGPRYSIAMPIHEQIDLVSNLHETRGMSEHNKQNETSSSRPSQSSHSIAARKSTHHTSLAFKGSKNHPSKPPVSNIDPLRRIYQSINHFETTRKSRHVQLMKNLEVLDHDRLSCYTEKFKNFQSRKDVSEDMFEMRSNSEQHRQEILRHVCSTTGAWFTELLGVVFCSAKGASLVEQFVVYYTKRMAEDGFGFTEPMLYSLIWSLSKEELSSDSMQNILKFFRIKLNIPINKWAEFFKVNRLDPPCEIVAQKKLEKKGSARGINMTSVMYQSKLLGRLKKNRIQRTISGISDDFASMKEE